MPAAMSPTSSGCPSATRDFSTIVASIPDDIDVVYVALGGADAVNFLSQYQQGGGSKPMIGGSITVDQTILGSKGPTKTYVVGTPSAGPIADNWDDPRWKAFVAAYKGGVSTASVAARCSPHGYYVRDFRHAGRARQGGRRPFGRPEEVPGGADEPRSRHAHRQGHARQEPPGRRRHLPDGGRRKGSDGNLYNKVVKVIPQVNQLLGMKEDMFLAMGSVSRDNPQCP
mgnify:CR=1 FL=1